MSNHVNIFDVFVLYGYIPGFIRGVELDEHFEWPFYGLLIRRFNSHLNATTRRIGPYCAITFGRNRPRRTHVLIVLRNYVL